MIDWKLWDQIQRVMTPLHWGFVIVAVSFSIWLIFWLRSYFHEDAEDEDSTLEMLTQFVELHQEGGLSDDEFRLIKSRLAHSAQGARVTEQPTSGKKLDKIVRQILTNSEIKPDNQKPALHATVENEAESERMTDKEME